MSVSTFKASHCGETFEGADGATAFVLHMKNAHKVTKPPTASWARPTPAWVNPNPLPWKAPKAPTDTRKLTEVLLKAETDSPWTGGLEKDWTTDEKAVPVSDLRPGDVFIYGRVYIVNSIEGDTLDLTARKDRNYPEASAKLTRAQIEAKTETVALIRRAA